jgi:hypothetical protein
MKNGSGTEGKRKKETLTFLKTPTPSFLSPKKLKK